jgi:hypothetical protein
VADFEIRASRELQTLANRLKTADKPLRRQLLKQVREAAKEAIPDVQQAAHAMLPRRGGLADRVAAQAYRVQASYAGRGARVRLAGLGMKELRDIDSGRLRHPVFGNREIWKQQAVQPGFFSETIAHRAPEIRANIERAIQDTAKTIEEGL